jgi:hypothetical protein
MSAAVVVKGMSCAVPAASGMCEKLGQGDGRVSIRTGARSGACRAKRCGKNDPSPLGSDSVRRPPASQPRHLPPPPPSAPISHSSCRESEESESRA